MSERATPTRRVPVQGLLLVAVVFVVGLLVGSAFERVRASRARPTRPFMENRGAIPGPIGRLDLTVEQRDRIVAIFESGRPITDSIMQQVMPRLRSMNDSIRNEIRDILTPDQMAQLESEYERRGVRKEDFGRRWRPGTRPPQ